MNTRKQPKAAYLFSEMGGIDDYLLQEALGYRPVQKRSASRLWVVAACIAMSLVLVFGGVLIGNLANTENQAPSLEDDGIDAPPDAPTLDALLTELSAGSAFAETSPERLDLFASASVVWKSSDSDTLCVSRPLTDTELESLMKAAKNGRSVDRDTSPTQTFRVWILDGNGSVTTPYLKSSAGNVGTTLFEYEAEVIPSQEFTSCLEAILRS